MTNHCTNLFNDYRKQKEVSRVEHKRLMFEKVGSNDKITDDIVWSMGKLIAGKPV